MTGPAINILGFIVQCEVCPQQAMLVGYVEGWLCPRCSDAGFGDVDVLAAEPIAHDLPLPALHGTYTRIEETELPYRPPAAKGDRFYRELLDDDEPDLLGGIRG